MEPNQNQPQPEYPSEATLTEEDLRARTVVEKLFKNDYGEPFVMTPGQIRLFRAIYEKQSPRLQFECYTQYGKSDVVSMAVLLRASTFQEKWILLGATKDKAGIIMSKLIKHLFENDYTLSKFAPDDKETLESIRRSKAKDNITFKVDSSGVLGQVITLSADARRKSQDAGDILIGHGGQNLIEDDAALIPDAIHGKALRMLGGHAGKDFLLKITNTFGRNHAYRSSHDPNFKKIVIDWRQGVKEGRLTQEFVNEMKASLDPIMFGILYDCVYPPSDMVDDKGWLALFTPELVEEAQKRKVESVGFRKFGVDISEGTNFNAGVVRTNNIAKIRMKSTEKDLMKTADGIVKIMDEDHIMAGNTFLDGIGVGAGVGARLKQMGREINVVKVGESATERRAEDKAFNPIEFANLRAEIYWYAREWIRAGGALELSKDWEQLTKIRYRENHNGKIQIMSKEEMRARGLLGPSESTDIPDALSLTFAPTAFRFSTIPKASPLAEDPYGAIIESTTIRTPDSKQFGGASSLPQII